MSEYENYKLQSEVVMFKAGSIEELARFYRGFSDRHMNGLWSILLTQNASESCIFGQKYFDRFNELAQQDWHLGICAEMQWNDNGYAWKRSEKMQKVSDGIRLDLVDSSNNVPDYCIVFFDPVLSDLHQRGFTENGLPEKNYQSNVVIVDLDWAKIGNTSFYMKCFEKTHEAIIKALHSNGIRQGDVISDEMYEIVLRSLADEIRNCGFRSSLRPWIERGKDSFFAGALGALIG